MVDMPLNQIKPNPIHLIYMCQEDLALDNLQWLICHKTKPMAQLAGAVEYTDCFSGEG